MIEKAISLCFNVFKLCFWGFQIQNSLYFNLSFHLFWSIFDRDCDWITFVDLSCQFLLSFVIKSVWNAGFLVRSRYYKFVTATLLLLRIIRRIKNDDIVGIRKYHEGEINKSVLSSSDAHYNWRQVFFNIWINHPLIATMSKDQNNIFLRQGTFTGKLAF